MTEAELQKAIEAARIAAVACNLLSVELAAIAEDLKALKVNLSLELQATSDKRAAEHREWVAFMGEMRGELDRIRADFRTDAMLLHLIKTPTGEEKWGGVKRKSSSPQSLRAKFASTTS